MSGEIFSLTRKLFILNSRHYKDGHIKDESKINNFGNFFLIINDTSSNGCSKSDEGFKLMKKGQMSTLAKMILVLVSALILFSVAVNITNLGKSFAEGDICQKSLALMDVSRAVSPFSQVGITEANVQPSDIPKCPMDKNPITMPKVGTEEEKLNLIKYQIAQKMNKCWSKTGSGAFEPFGGGTWKAVVQDTKVFCIICAQVKFDEKIQDEWDEIEGLYGYLATHKPPTSQYTYKTIFATQLGRVIVHPVRPEYFKRGSGRDSLETDDTYYIVWRFSKGGGIGLGGWMAGIRFVDYSKDNILMALTEAETFQDDLRCDPVFLWY